MELIKLLIENPWSLFFVVVMILGGLSIIVSSIENIIIAKYEAMHGCCECNKHTDDDDVCTCPSGQCTCDTGNSDL